MLALARLVRAAFVILRLDAFDFLDANTQIKPPRPLRVLARLLAKRTTKTSTRAQRLSSALERLGPSYIKLGQFLATRADIIGESLARDLSVLQDKLPPFPRKKAIETIEREFGVPVGNLFEDFGEAVAAASIAQVHRCRLSAQDEGESRNVAVKVLRPGIEKRFERDLADFFWIARWVERLSPATRRLRPVQVVETLAASVRQEMDLRMEAAALSEAAENIDPKSGFRVPKPDWQRISQRVLTTDWIEGIALSDIDAIRAADHDTKALATRIIQIFLKQAMEDGFFHADMHPGNLFVESDGTIVAVDFGIMSRLDGPERQFLAGVLHGFLQRDYQRVAELHFRLGYVPRHQDVDNFALALRAIGEPITDKDATDISMSRLLLQLFQVTAQFDMPTQPRLLLLQKTMVVVEGVARSLDSGHNMWKSAKPVAKRWMERNLGFQAQVKQISDVVREIPAALENAASALQRVEAGMHSPVNKRESRSVCAILWAGGLGGLALGIAGVIGWVLGRTI